LAERGQKVHEPLDGEVAGLPTHQTGNMRLPDAQNRAGLCLCESPTQYTYFWMTSEVLTLPKSTE
jgi:hypothetical protein